MADWQRIIDAATKTFQEGHKQIRNTTTDWERNSFCYACAAAFALSNKDRV